MRKPPNKILSRAVGVQTRVFADLAARWLREDNGDCAAAWTRRGALVIVAIDEQAALIAGELTQAGLLEFQTDKPEHMAAGQPA